MKTASNSNRLYSKYRLLFGLLVVLLSGCLLLAIFGGIPKTFATRINSAQTSDSSRVPLQGGVTSTSDPAHRFDQQGNRALGMSFLSRHSRATRAISPTGTGNWFSLGPPGGDVFDAAASTTDSNIVLAGLAPGGSFGGTLYRSSDGGSSWSEVLPLDGTSVFDIEFAADGTAYLATQDSV